MASAQTVTICSKLPMALILKVSDTKHTIRGLNAAPGATGPNKRPIIVPYMTTEIPKDFWDAWKALNDHPTKGFAPLKAGSIFEAKNEEFAKGAAKERAKIRTGLEPMQKDGDSRMGADARKLKAFDGKEE